MAIETRPDGAAILHLADDPRFTSELERLSNNVPENATRILLDLSQVNYINSSNLARLLRLRKQLQELEIPLYLCAPAPRVEQVFHVTALDRLLQIVPTVEAAED